MPETSDKNRRPIRVGDVLKVYHFTGARRKRHYMYKQVTRTQWLGGFGGKPKVLFFFVSHLDLKPESVDGDGGYASQNWMKYTDTATAVSDAILALADQDPADVHRPMEELAPGQWVDVDPKSLATTQPTALKPGQYVCDRCKRTVWGGDHVCPSTTTQPTVQQADRFHDEQVQIWAQEILEALALNDLINIESYDDKVVASRLVCRELKSIGRALAQTDTEGE